MRIDWGMMLTIFLAIVVARIFEKGLFSKGSSNSSTQVGAVTHSPAEPVVVYRNAIDQFIAEHHPDAIR